MCNTHSYLLWNGTQVAVPSTQHDVAEQAEKEELKKSTKSCLGHSMCQTVWAVLSDICWWESPKLSELSTTTENSSTDPWLWAMELQ